MSEVVSQFVLLCEDQMHERMVRAYMRICGYESLERRIVRLVASEMTSGGNSGWVLDEFPKQLNACRKRQAKTLLIVLLDVDTFTVEDRRRQLNERLKASEFEPLRSDDPLSLLLPKRHVETWIRSLNGEEVSEEDDCKAHRAPDKKVVRDAARILYEWSRTTAVVGDTCVPSLRESLAEWRKIG